jgi:hypothetical protein
MFQDTWPKMPLSLPKDKDNILITNVQYLKPAKLEMNLTNGKSQWSDDILYVVYRDFDTKKKNLQIIKNPTSSIYTTKKEFMNDFSTQREFMPLDKLDRHDIKFNDVTKFLSKQLNNNLLQEEDRTLKSVMEKAAELGKWNGKKEVHKWRNAYFSDYDLQDYVYTTSNLYLKPQETTLTKSYLDIETDIFKFSKYDQETGKCKITAITIIYDYAQDLSKKYKPKAFTLLLRDHKRFPQQKKFEDNMDSFMDKVHDEFDKKYGEIDYTIKIFDDELEMLFTLFQLQHMMKPDFTGIWHMAFDLIYIMKKAIYLGVSPESLFCHPDFKNLYAHYHLDERYKNDYKNRGDNFNCLSYTKYTDLMLNYAARRKGDKDYGANKLDNIARIELKEKKRPWAKKSTNTINAAIEEYENFVLYNIKDVLLLMGIERKTEDIDDMFYKGYESATRIDKANRQTVSLKNLWNLGHFEQGYCMGNNLNVDYLSAFGHVEEIIVDEEDEEKLKGALVGDSTFINDIGVELFNGRRSNKLFVDGIDLDATQMYPNIKMKNNMARSTQYGRLIIKGKVSDMEYYPTTALRGGEFVDDYEVGDWIKLGVKWFKLKKLGKYIREFDDYLAKNKNIIRMNKTNDVFFELWSEKVSSIFKVLFPDKKQSTIMSYLKYAYNRDIKDVSCMIYNNYDQIEYNTTLVSVIDWIDEIRPIMSSSGCFFKRHEVSGIVPGLIILDNLGKQRKKLKNLELAYEAAGDKENARMFGLKQNRKKKFSNSDYGVTGSPSGFSYNFHVAQSVTSTAQSEISLVFTTLDEFLCDTIQFYDMDELLNFCDNILSEKINYKDNEILKFNRTREDVKKRLLRKCVNIKENIKHDIIDKYIENVPQEYLNRLYYKSNLMEFINDSKYTQNLLYNFSIQASSFVFNKKVTKLLSEMNKMVLEYCQYNYPYYGRIERLVNTKRNAVLVIDTDSCILTVNSLKKRIKEFCKPMGNLSVVMKNSESNRAKEDEDLKYINAIAVMLTEVVDRALKKFEIATNCQESPLGIYSFKNEFIYNVLLLGNAKKRYIGGILVREGTRLDPPKRDVKGYDFIKVSFAPEKIRIRIEDIIFKHIVSNKINPQKALKKFFELEDDLRKSLLEGDRELLQQAKVNTIDSYKKPMEIGTFKATYIWNQLYPEHEVILPNVVNLVKISIKSPKDIAELALENREIFDKLSDILANDLKTGITQIAIPMDIDDIPEWILKYADIEEMLGKYMSMIEPILDVIGIKSVYKTQSQKFISNIVEIG